MAKKKETLTFGQLPYPSDVKRYKSTKVSWSGLNMRQTTDTGVLSMEKNISTIEAPYLTPSPAFDRYYEAKYDNPLGLFGFDDFLLAIYYDESDKQIKVDYIIGEDDYETTVYTGVIPQYEGIEMDTVSQRSVVQFNLYETVTDATGGSDDTNSEDDVENGLNINGYVKKLLIFPDKVSMDFYITKDDFEISPMEVVVKEYYNDEPEIDESGATIYPPPESANQNYYYRNTWNSEQTNYGTDVYMYTQYDTVERTETKNEDGSTSVEYGTNPDGGTAFGWKVCVPPSVPDLKYVAVHVSRLFGVDDSGRVYASGFNNYANWNLDTVDSYNEANAWCSATQSNSKADGNFTGITAFDGHVICFKRDFMHELYNTKNPFRVQDIYAEGAIDNRSIQEVDGKLFFVSDDNVKIYTGSNPRIASYNLNIKEFKEAVSGSDGRCYYLYCVDETDAERLFVYDTYVQQWSERQTPTWYLSDDPTDEDKNVKVISFAHNSHGMFMLCSDGNVYKLDTADYTHTSDEDAVGWCFETDLMTNQTVDIKHIKKLQMLCDIDSGAWIKLYFIYDGKEFDENTAHLIYDSGGRTGKVPIRVMPRKTANFGLRLHAEGNGFVRIYEMELMMTAGGELYV